MALLTDQDNFRRFKKRWKTTCAKDMLINFVSYVKLCLKQRLSNQTNIPSISRSLKEQDLLRGKRAMDVVGTVDSSSSWGIELTGCVYAVDMDEKIFKFIWNLIGSWINSIWMLGLILFKAFGRCLWLSSKLILRNFRYFKTFFQITRFSGFYLFSMNGLNIF